MKILVAEDNLFYRHALSATLKEWGYEVVAVGDGAAALEILEGPASPKLAIIDWMMPKMDGLEVCRRIRSLHTPEPHYLIVLTSNEGKQNIVTALESGADDFVAKPFDRGELQARIKVGLRIVGLQTTQTVIFTFARSVEAKSPFTQGHSDRVKNLCLRLADKLGLSVSDKDILRKGALLHDIGKISIPDGILNKPSGLTAEEFEVMKTHPTQGVKIVQPLENLQELIPLIRWHHERLDGTGYPDRLSGSEIPYLVRLLTVADCYDALSSARPYRGPLAHSVCMDILQTDAAAGKLDRDLVTAFSELDHPHEAASVRQTESFPANRQSCLMTVSVG